MHHSKNTRTCQSVITDSVDSHRAISQLHKAQALTTGQATDVKKITAWHQAENSCTHEHTHTWSNCVNLAFLSPKRMELAATVPSALAIMGVVLPWWSQETSGKWPIHCTWAKHGRLQDNSKITNAMENTELSLSTHQDYVVRMIPLRHSSNRNILLVVSDKTLLITLNLNFIILHTFSMR